MQRYFLTRLTIEGFRGINNENDPLDISFRPDAVNSIFAENGIGKSSIFEALCYAIHGTIPKLDLLQTQERPQDYYCNHFHSGNTAIIHLEFQPDDANDVISIRIERDARGTRRISSPSGYTDPDGFLATLKKPFALLDYRTFSHFIEDSPLERGRTFSALLGLADYSDCRQALQAISDTRAMNSDFEINVLTTAKDAAHGTVQRARTTLMSSYQSVTGKPFDDIEKINEYLAEITAALGSVELLKPLFVGKSLMDVEFEEVKIAIKTAEGGDKPQELVNTVGIIAELEKLTEYDLTKITTEQKQIGLLIDERENLFEAVRGELFKHLYETANEIITKGDWKEDNICPLCESELSSSISTHINQQLTQYVDAKTKITEISNAWSASEWRKYLSAYENSAPLGVELSHRQFARLDTEFNTGKISKDYLTTVIRWTNELRYKAIDILTASRDNKSKLERELPPSLVQLTEQVEYGKQFKEALILYLENQKKKTELQARLDFRERWKQFISNAANIFANAEALLSKARIRSIDSEYKSMFREIMQVGDVVPNLQRADDREDLNMQLSEFHGLQKLSARALLSESYRNALAISVFLAAALKYSGTPRFVVLDDVTSSFDAGHQYFLMELIRTKLQQPQSVNGLQFIILSHDGLLEKYFDRLGGSIGWHHNKLQGSPPMGAVLHMAQGADRLKITISTFLSAGQTSHAKPFVRQYLEYKLLQIIRQLEIPVPIDFAIKDTSKMVNNCLNAISSAINLHKKAGTLILNAQQIQDIDTVHVPAIVGNWASHYETSSGSSISAHTLGGIITSIDALSECFRYDDTSGGSTARKWYRSLSSR